MATHRPSEEGRKKIEGKNFARREKKFPLANQSWNKQKNLPARENSRSGEGVNHGKDND
jgi:hypothetical protein